MPRRCAPCTNARRRLEDVSEHRELHEETNTDCSRRVRWTKKAFGCCKIAVSSVANVLNRRKSVIMIIMVLVVAWIVYNEFSSCVTNFLWNVVYYSLGIIACSAGLFLLCTNDVRDDSPKKDSEENNSAQQNDNRESLQ